MQNRIRFETFELNLQTGELSKAGSRVQLQDQPTRLLTLLANRHGELVTRDEIHHELWKDGEFVEFEHAVNTAINKIRKALDDDPDKPRIIQTLPKKGYRFIAPVDVLERIPASPPPSETQTAEPVPAKPPTNGENFVLPISTVSSRILFLLAQVPYVATYLATFYNWDNLDAALIRTFVFIPIEWSRTGFQIFALVGFAVRIYLIGLVGWGHTEAGPRYRKLFPFLLFMDGLGPQRLFLLLRTWGPWCRGQD